MLNKFWWLKWGLFMKQKWNNKIEMILTLLNVVTKINHISLIRWPRKMKLSLRSSRKMIKSSSSKITTIFFTQRKLIVLLTQQSRIKGKKRNAHNKNTFNWHRFHFLFFCLLSIHVSVVSLCQGQFCMKGEVKKYDE